MQTPIYKPKEEQKMQDKILTAARVTPEDIEANIAKEVYFTAADGIAGASIGFESVQQGVNTEHTVLTFCVLTLSNGFTVTGESACVAPENFDAKLGRKIAKEHAVNKIWPLMGYELKTRLVKKVA